MENKHIFFAEIFKKKILFKDYFYKKKTLDFRRFTLRKVNCFCLIKKLVELIKFIVNTHTIYDLGE